MRVALLKLEGCKEGYKIADDVYNKNGGMLVPKDYIITDRVISYIRGNEIDAVKVYLDDDEKSPYEILEELIQPAMNVLQKTVNEYKSVRSTEIVKVEETFFDISRGKPVNKGMMDSLSGNITEAFDTRLIPFIGNLKVSDNYTLEHSLNMGTLAFLFGKWIGFDDKKSNDLIQSALLHDLGRAKISPEILNKPGKLTPEEYEQVKQHPSLSYKMIQESAGLSKDIKMGVLMHHEREDGSGYPLGAKGAQIHEFGKLLAIIDTYDAMTTDRIFKPKTFALKVLNELYESSFDKLEYRYVNIFIKNMLNYFLGCTVRLSTDELGYLVHIDIKNILKPIVKIDNSVVNLMDEIDMEVIEFV